jgi:hypothetical protein
LSLNWSLHFIISKAMLWKNWWKRGEVTRIMYNEILQFHSSFWIVSFLDTGYFLYMHEILQGIFLSIGCDRFKFTIMGLFFATPTCVIIIYIIKQKKSWTKFFLLFWVTKHLLWWPMYMWNLFWKHVKQQHLETKFNVVVEWVE